jgi:queuine tRNA-ribosyltransferase
MEFILEAEEGKARAGTLRLRGREIPTPVFMPVGTRACVRTLSNEDVEALGYQLILANTYHLLLRPGGDLLEELGGLHDFWSWPGGILTDSGGYQVFSLDKMNRKSEEGVEFASYINGARHFLSPEISAKLQVQFGSDIVMAFDECLPWPLEKAEVRTRTERSLRWTQRSHKAFLELRQQHQNFFGILQGGEFDDLRRFSGEGILELDCDGYAIGGLAIGEPLEIMRGQTEVACGILPRGKPRYLMGVGTPLDLVESVARGVDMFDCVMPTRAGRHEQWFTFQEGRLNLRNARFKTDSQPVEDGCPCVACQRYSRAYLHHLGKCKEETGKRLATLHNLTHYRRLMERMRAAILEGRFASFHQGMLRKEQA